MIPTSWLCLVVALLLLLLCHVRSSTALCFYLNAGEQRCFFDEAPPPGYKVLGEYTVTAGNGIMSVHLHIRSANPREARKFMHHHQHHHQENVVVEEEEEEEEDDDEDEEHEDQKEEEEELLLFHKENIDHGNFAFVLPPPSSQHHTLAQQHAAVDRPWNTGTTGARHTAGEHDITDREEKEEFHNNNNNNAIDHTHLRQNTQGPPPPPHVMDPGPMSALGQENVLNEYDAFGAKLMMTKHSTDDSRNEFDVRRFQICLTSPGPRRDGVQRRIRLIIRKGDAAHDYYRIARKEHMNHLERSLTLIAADLHELLTLVEKTHRMEEALRVLHYETNTAVVRYAVFSVIVVFVIGALQARFTRSFFKTKKLS